ncbi:putative protein C9orf50 [Galemys pyrenaicus]|uniref:DUF4685 domain-containing protein n=1 Tax=Galemys pyrenaicus TaxID=202257 RepID=A0A8J6A5Y4_GALPY|nr:putative protein C9orf50 [Galemys pyrenaicus]
MPRRHPKPGAQQVAPQGFPGDGDRRSRAPPLPRLTQPELRAAPGAKGSRMSVGGSGWWPDSRSEWSHLELAGGGRSSRPHLPALPTAAQRAAQNRRVAKSLLLPPLFLAPQDPAPPRRGPEQREDARRDSVPEGPEILGALLGELLPSRFRQFLRQLGAHLSSAMPEGGVREPPALSEFQPLGARRPAVSARDLQGAALPRMFPGGRSPYLRTGLQKALLHQIPDLGLLRSGQSQYNISNKSSQFHSPQAPKLKAVLSPSSSGEGSGPHRRCCPFRVRFADETLRDAAIRYWERYCTGFVSLQSHDVLGPEARDFHRAPAPPVFRNSSDMDTYWGSRPAEGREPGLLLAALRGLQTGAGAMKPAGMG